MAVMKYRVINLTNKLNNELMVLIENGQVATIHLDKATGGLCAELYHNKIDLNHDNVVDVRTALVDVKIAGKSTIQWSELDWSDVSEAVNLCLINLSDGCWYEEDLLLHDSFVGLLVHSYGCPQMVLNYSIDTCVATIKKMQTLGLGDIELCFAQEGGFDVITRESVGSDPLPLVKRYCSAIVLYEVAIKQGVHSVDDVDLAGFSDEAEWLRETCRDLGGENFANWCGELTISIDTRTIMHRV
ncbi:hypothetical protein [Photobacterium leiognathi]|uniref:hypothetical protein n=1 Tax=Photobacterium leiognathi TaxID=553611 RepID=UPI0029818F1B|nr:hypothetical protein [Photobacterium leiognathi]